MHRDFAELDAFEGGEARAAILTLTAATDRRAVLGRTAVLHLAVFMSEIGAAHGRATNPAVERHRGAPKQDKRAAADGQARHSVEQGKIGDRENDLEGGRR